jgi:hypothetical protein
MAHALKFHTVVSGKTLSLPDLGAFEGKRVQVTVVEESAAEVIMPRQDDIHTGSAPSGRATPARRPLGLYRGQFTIPDDFDEPLSPDIQKYFDGEGSE